MTKFGLGQAVPRKEDSRFLTGSGCYTDDINLDGQAHICFLRSPVAHADLGDIDISAAVSSPGVIAVYTGADLVADGHPPMQPMLPIKDRDGSMMYFPPRLPMTADRARYVGEIVAMVVAETFIQARDASELIMAEYDELPVNVVTENAVLPETPSIWPDCNNNTSLHFETGDPVAVQAAFDVADEVVEVKLINNRLIANPMEPRAALAEYDAATDTTTLYCPSQGTQRMVRMMAEKVLKIDPKKLRIVSRDVGGGFGVRSKAYPEQYLVVWATKKLGRPVKWRGDRFETMVTDNHGRDNVTVARMAMDSTGKATAVQVDTIAGMGAYLFEMGAAVPTTIGTPSSGTAYDIPLFHLSVRCVFTNTTPTDSYRGAGRPEASYVMERLMERAGRQLGIGVDEVRKRNFIPEAAMPYTNQQDYVIDSGRFDETLTLALDKADWNGFEARRKDAIARGMLSGIGIGYFLEKSGGQQTEFAQVGMNEDGEVDVSVGVFSHGQGLETVMAQVVVERLGVDFNSINYRDAGDSQVVTEGGGTSGSRSSQMGGVAIARACEGLIEKGAAIAAHLLQADPSAITYDKETTSYQVSGGGSMTLNEVATAARDADKLPDGMEPGLHQDMLYDRGPTFNSPNGAHIAEIEIDPETGVIDIVRWSAVEDTGVVLNPMVVHGQTMGGVAQGLGQAILEHTVYDEETGQILSASFMDYGMPRAADMPFMDVANNEVVCPTNDLGVKGAGEGGTCGAPSALVNAVLDAMRDDGVETIDMPLTPERVWRTLQDARAKKAS